MPVCPFVNRECTTNCKAYMARDGRDFCGVISAILNLGKQLRDLTQVYLFNSKEG
ncbi:MAG: hypothetical protein QME75_16090 [Deltaproteobacteria bacterium]|nr:hypothetical protein [Deltaproteobacteria bacterium]